MCWEGPALQGGTVPAERGVFIYYLCREGLSRDGGSGNGGRWCRRRVPAGCAGPRAYMHQMAAGRAMEWAGGVPGCVKMGNMCTSKLQ